VASTESGEKSNKPFLMRNVPADLHRRWKLLAVTLGKSMEEIFLESLNAYIDNELKKLQKELESE
jgi:plasmid stability protein